MSDTDHLPGRRRFGWYLPKPDGCMDIKIESNPIDENIWNEFRRYTRVVEVLRPYMVDYFALSADADDVRTAETDIGALLSRQFITGMIDTLAGVDANTVAQRRVSNFLGAASAFRDRSARRLLAEFGKSSSEVDAFKSATAHWFDTSFAYRCLYHLRNFAQHHELPISFMPINADRVPGCNMTARVVLQLYPKTLSGSRLVNAKVRAELEATPVTELDFSALAAEYRQAHDGLMALVLSIYAPRLEEMAHYAAAIYRRFEIPHNVVPVIWEGDDPALGPDTQKRAIMMGFDEMMRAFQLRESLHVTG